MKKTLVGLSVPAIQGKFDLLVPANMEISELIKLFIEGVTELCGGHYTPSELCLLTLKYPDMLLHPGKTLADYGVGDGAQLVLF